MPTLMTETPPRLISSDPTTGEQPLPWMSSRSPPRRGLNDVLGKDRAVAVDQQWMVAVDERITMENRAVEGNAVEVGHPNC